MINLWSFARQNVEEIIKYGTRVAKGDGGGGVGWVGGGGGGGSPDLVPPTFFSNVESLKVIPFNCIARPFCASFIA